MSSAVFLTDFNEWYDQALLVSQGVKIGDEVGLLDHDGNYCRGIVETMSVSTGLVYVRPDMNTWVPALDDPDVVAGPVTSADPRIQRNTPPRPAPRPIKVIATEPATTGENYLG
jgi:hypothetical protein